MESISMHNAQRNSKIKDLILTASIVSLFAMHPHQIQAQSIDKKNTKWTKEYFTDPLLLFKIPQKDVNVEFPGWDKYFLSLIHPKIKEISVPTKQIEHKTQLPPLSFTKRNIHKYFPEREACFKEIIAQIEQDPIFAHKINTILLQTVMKPRMVHKETNRRPMTDKDMTGANMLVLEWIMWSTKFSDDLDKKDKLDVLESDTVTYDTRLYISDHSQIAREMIQPALEATQMFWDRQKKLQAENQQITAKSDSTTASR